MKKIISLILSLAMLMSIPSYIANAEENDLYMPVSAGEPSEWAFPEIDEAMFKGIITDSVCIDFQADITREQFCELILKVYEKLNEESIATDGISFTDTDNESILKASAIGIVNGYGDGIFAPNDKITREQIATMIVRMLDKAKIGLDISKYNDNEFADKETISEWALPFVNFLYDTGIMKGTGENAIEPLSNTSCEEGIILAYRSYNKFAYYGKKTLAVTLSESFEKIANDDVAALSIAEELMKNEIIKFPPVVQEYEEEYLPGFANYEVNGYKECAIFSPMIGTVPFVGYIFTLEDSTDAESFKTELEENSNLSWNICTTADERVVTIKGNKVFFVMCPYGIDG